MKSVTSSSDTQSRDEKMENSIVELFLLAKTRGINCVSTREKESNNYRDKCSLSTSFRDS